MKVMKLKVNNCGIGSIFLECVSLATACFDRQSQDSQNFQIVQICYSNVQ